MIPALTIPGFLTGLGIGFVFGVLFMIGGVVLLMNWDARRYGKPGDDSHETDWRMPPQDFKA